MPDPRLDTVLGSAAWNRRDGSLVALPFIAVEGEDHLRILTACSLSNLAVTIAGRQRLSDGTLKPFKAVFNPTNDRMVHGSRLYLDPGYLLDVIAYVSAGAPKIGECFVLVQLIRGFTGGIELIGELLADYVTAVQPVSWPGSPIRSSIEGGGVIKSVTGTKPAAGVEITETVPSGARWTLSAARTVLTTAVGGANRAPFLYATNPSVIVLTAFSATLTIPAATIKVIDFLLVPAAQERADAAEHLVPLWHDAPLLAGYQLKSGTINLAAGDQWEAPILQVREWLEVDG